MHITEKQALERLNSPNNLANRFARVDNQIVQVEERVIHSPGKNRVNLDENTRTEIAIQARLGMNQNDIARDFGVTQGEVSQIKNNKVQGVDERAVERSLNEVRDQAVLKLMESLGLITSDKLSALGAQALSIVAANMSKVVEKTMPNKDNKNNINLIIYTPEMRSERGFDFVEIAS